MFDFTFTGDHLDERYKLVKEQLKKSSPLVVASIKTGILLVTESHTILKKTSEIYDRIAFGAIGKYAEFDAFRQEIIYIADIKGHNYSRQDVKVERLVTHVAKELQILFADLRSKPPMLKIILAEVNNKPEGDKIFRIAADGDIKQYFPYAVIGGDDEEIEKNLKTMLGKQQMTDLNKGEAILLIKEAIRASKNGDAKAEEVKFEIAYLNRKKTGRCFARL